VFDFDPDYDQGKYRKAKFSEADEDRDNPTFIAWELLSDYRLTFIHEKLNNICECVSAGDRNAMLELLDITADELVVFDTLPLELRASLSDGLKKVGNTLRQTRGTKGFLPPLRRELSEKNKLHKNEQAFIATLQVEYHRFHGHSLEEARTKVAEETFRKEDLIHKYWKKAHRQAKPFFETTSIIYDVVEKATGINPDPTRRKKKVR